MTPDTLPGEPPADPRADAYAATRAAARTTAAAALAAAVAHTARMEAAGYRLEGAVWVRGVRVAAAEAVAVQRREIGVGVGVVDVPVSTCPKCGAKGAAFICSTRGCPVNGGAAYD